MITTRSLNAAEVIFHRLKEDGRCLAAKDESPLAELIRCGVTEPTYMQVTKDSIELPVEQILRDSMHEDDLHGYKHDSKLAEMTEQCSKVMLGQLTLARTVTVPAIHDVIDRYQKTLSDVPHESSEPAVILPNVYHAIWATPELEGLTNRFHNVPMDTLTTPFILPSLTDEELKEMMFTSMDSLDTVIESWYNDLPENFVKDTYETFFVRGEGKLGNITGPKHITVDFGYTRNSFLVLFLIASHFENRLPDGVRVELSKLRTGFSAVRAQAGRLIGSELKKREAIQGRKALIFDIKDDAWEYSETDRRVVMVNNDVYLTFLNNGGSVEAIYGAVLSSTDIPTYTAILERKDDFEKIYAKHRSFHLQRLSANVFNVQRHAARKAMIQHINDTDVEDLPASLDKVLARLNDCINALKPASFKNEAIAIRCLVCDVLFPDTNIGDFLDATDTVELADPNATPDECRLHATIDLICKYVASQMTVKTS